MNAKTQAELLKSSKAALATYRKKSLESQKAARATLIKLGTHGKDGALTARYK